MNLLKTIQLSVLLAVAGSCASAQTAATTNEFSFVMAGDMRNFVEPLPDGKRQFDGACEAIRSAGAGAFLVVPGDFDPPAPVRGMIDRYLGTNYFCYFVVGTRSIIRAAIVVS